MGKSTSKTNIQVLYQHSKGLCLCGQAVDTESPWYIKVDQAQALVFLKHGLEKSNSYTCLNCNHTQAFATATLLDIPQEKKLVVAIAESLSFNALAYQGNLLQKLAMEAEVNGQDYYHNAQIIIGNQALKACLKQYNLALTFAFEDGITNQAPVIHSLPSRLQSSTMADNMEFVQELAESQTQVIKPKNKTNIHTEVTKTGKLDALIDSALDDSTAVTEKKDSHRGSKKELSNNNSIASVNSDRTSTDPSEKPRELPQLKPLAEADPKQDLKTVISDYTPDLEIEELSPTSQSKEPTEPTKLLYAQNMKQFDQSLAKGASKYLNIIDGVVEFAAKIDEKRAESWISDQLDVRMQLHRDVQLGAPCLTIFTLKDGIPQDELYWPIQIDDSLGPKTLRNLRKNFKFDLALYKRNGKFYGQRTVEAPLEENTAYIINYVKQMGMTSSSAAKVRATISAEDFDRDGQMKHHFNQESFSEIKSAKDALMAVGIWSYWSTVRQRDYLIFIKSFPIPWLRRLQHRVLSGAIEVGIHMPVHLQSQAVSLGLAKSDVELLQKSITHYVEVNVNFRVSQLDTIETWENWDALLAQLAEMGIDADEEVEQLAFQAMQKAGIDLEFEEDELTGADSLEIISELPEQDSVAEVQDELSSIDESFDDISEISEVQDLSDVPPSITQQLETGSDEDYEADEESIELISEDFIEEEYLTDVGGDAFLLIDDGDIIEEDIIDPVTAEMGEKLSKNTSFEFKTQMFVSSANEEDTKASASEEG